MFAALGQQLKSFFTNIGNVVKQRRQRKLAKLAELEKRERKAIVETLVQKLEDAHTECEQEGKSSAVLVVSLKEIIFLERNVYAWMRHFKESQIYAAPAKRRTIPTRDIS
jgi:type I site-specific restriction-modification system R (restriction) subunit